MKIKNIKDPKGFFEKLKECKGTLEIVTPQGDRLNLKSKLSQIMGLTQLIEGGIIVDATIRCEKPEDESKLVRFDLFREVPKD